MMYDEFFKEDKCPICEKQVEKFIFENKSKAFCHNKCATYAEFEYRIIIKIFDEEYRFGVYDDMYRIRDLKKYLEYDINFWRKNERYLTRLMGT